MSDENRVEMIGLTRRDFLRWMGIGSGTAALSAGLPLRLLAAARPGENPLAGSVDRAWEKIYRDQYKYDRAFDWDCSPNDTHACRVRAFVRNGIVTRLVMPMIIKLTPTFTATRLLQTGTRASAPRATPFTASSMAPTG